jgi:hypothetical protein
MARKQSASRTMEFGNDLAQAFGVKLGAKLNDIA